MIYSHTFLSLKIKDYLVKVSLPALQFVTDDGDYALVDEEILRTQTFYVYGDKMELLYWKVGWAYDWKVTLPIACNHICIHFNICMLSMYECLFSCMSPTLLSTTSKMKLLIIQKSPFHIFILYVCVCESLLVWCKYMKNLPILIFF